MTLKKREYSSDLGEGGYIKLRRDRIGERTREKPNNEIISICPCWRKVKSADGTVHPYQKHGFSSFLPSQKVIQTTLT